MRIYQAQYSDPHDGWILSWHDSRRAATDHLEKVAPDHRATHMVTRHTINRGALALIAWLNLNFTRDNG